MISIYVPPHRVECSCSNYLSQLTLDAFDTVVLLYNRYQMEILNDYIYP